MTETVQAPESTEAETSEGNGTEAKAAEPKATVTLKERLQKAISKDMPAAHTGFV